MCGKKKKASCMMPHPVLCGAIVGFAVIGIYGVVMAVKKKKKSLSKAAKELGCECVENVREMAEDAIDGMAHVMQGKQA